jgi:DNA-directed RNA polymerase subunit RPC12/RpoP
MFKKRCARCGRAISKNYLFCPYCGSDFRILDSERKKQGDYGFLGRDDDVARELGFFNMKMPFGFNKIFDSLLKEVDKQFKELDRKIGKEPEFPKIREMNKGFSISISTETGKEPKIQIKTFGPGAGELRQELEKEITGKKQIKKKIEISEEKAKKLASLPRHEAETKVRRFSNKIIYEIELPGVKDVKDVFVNKLENSIEVKAFGKDKVYFKLIPLNLPILNYKLKDEKLVLELAEK